MTGDDSQNVIAEVIEDEKERPYQWEELASVDQENIRRYIQRRRRQGADDDELYHELGTLVPLAARVTDKPLSQSRLQDFQEPSNRPGRVLSRFLIFTGSESPRCPKCGDRDYEPDEEQPEYMRCQGCTFLFTERELSYLI